MFATDIDRVAEEVRGVSPAGAARNTLVDGIAALARLRGALDSAESRFVAEIDSLSDNGLDSSGVLRAVTHCSGREATKRARRAAALTEMPIVESGLASGAIPTETIDSLVRAAAAISPEAVNSDDGLMSMARSRPADLASREIRDWIRSYQKTDDAEKQFEQQLKDRKAIWFTNSAGMVVCNIEFDPVTGAVARTRMDAETESLWRSDGGRDGRPDEIRTPAQRRCDAVARLFGVASPHEADNAGNVKPPGHTSTTVVVVADIGVVDGSDPDGRCEIIDSGPVPASILARLPPDTTWHGALFNGPGRPLWLGRGRRMANNDQRLMAAARDRGCVSCGAPTSRCQAHHVESWADGGSTDIDGMALLCQRCHTLVHEGHLRLHCQRDGTWSALPTVGNQRGASAARDGPITGEAAA